MKSILSALCFTVFTIKLFAQLDSVKHLPFESRKKSLAIVAGYYYYGRSALEIGFGKRRYDLRGYHPFSAAMYTSAEFFYSNKLFVAPKIGVWASGGASAINLGLSLIDYTDFNQSALQLRPEIGIGVDYFRVYYGRNIHITNVDFNLVSKNLLGINILFDIKRLHPNKN